MKVILSAEPIRYPLTGVGRYTLELAQHLRQHPDIELRYFLNDQITDELPTPEESEPAQTRIRHTLKQAIIRNRFALASAQTLLSVRRWRRLRAYRDHIYHGPNFYLPIFDGPSIATIHDLSVYVWGDHHPAERVQFMRKEVELTLKRADLLITDSEFVRNEISDYFGYPQEKIKAIPLAASDRFHPRTPRETQECLEGYGLKPGEYCFYTGTIEPRKNLDRLIDAYASLPDSVSSRWPLVLCGYKGWKSEALRDRITSLQRHGWIQYLGFVPQNDLPLLMSGARAFAFPSLYEGFGLPVIEAMASGVPVVCSNAASLPEVSGNVALACDPEDTSTLAQLLQRALEDEVWREEATSKGLQWASKFSWQKCAASTAAVYGELQQHATS